MYTLLLTDTSVAVCGCPAVGVVEGGVDGEVLGRLVVPELFDPLLPLEGFVVDGALGVDGVDGVDGAAGGVGVAGGVGGVTDGDVTVTVAPLTPGFVS
jgi:hypothetical protein